MTTARAPVAPEIMPGVVFYHAHLDAVDEALVFVGVCPEGARVPRAGRAVRVVLALLAPTTLSPEAYLRRLAVVAQLVKTEATVEALLAAETPEAAREVLFGTLRDTLDGPDDPRDDDDDDGPDPDDGDAHEG